MSDTTTGEAGGPRLLAGRYRIDGLLGRGGMSEVYFGYDERLDRRVAIKVLRTPAPIPGLMPDSPAAAEILDERDRDRRRFLREIRVTAFSERSTQVRNLDKQVARLRLPGAGPGARNGR